MFKITDDSPIKQRRLKRFFISVQTIAEIATPKKQPVPYVDYCAAGLPDGCEVCGVMYDHARHCFAVIVVNSVFEPVPEGMEIPSVDIEMRREHKPGLEVVK